MIVGAAVIDIHVHASQSLKQKRGVVRSISQRVRNRFNVAVAEVGGQQTWQLSTLGIVSVGLDPVAVRRVLERVCEFVEDLHLAEVLHSDVEITELPTFDAEAMSEVPDPDPGE